VCTKNLLSKNLNAVSLQKIICSKLLQKIICSETALKFCLSTNVNKREMTYMFRRSSNQKFGRRVLIAHGETANDGYLIIVEKPSFRGSDGPKFFEMVRRMQFATGANYKLATYTNYKLAQDACIYERAYAFILRLNILLQPRCILLQPCTYTCPSCKLELFCRHSAASTNLSTRTKITPSEPCNLVPNSTK